MAEDRDQNRGGGGIGGRTGPRVEGGAQGGQGTGNSGQFAGKESERRPSPNDPGQRSSGHASGAGEKRGS